MITVNVSASRVYDIKIGEGLLDELGRLIKEVKKPCKTVIITDDIVSGLYARRAAESLEGAGFTTETFVFPNGEKSKNTDTYLAAINFCADCGLHRDDLIVALGGGVVGDVAGFAAATYMRGIAYIQVATTLLAAIDSSVGGKTGVDLAGGKNMLGAFYQPHLVVCDTLTLASLPHERVMDGLGEGLKYAVLCGGEIITLIKNKLNEANIARFIELCVSCKRDIVEADEKETTGARKLLNLGHTFAHAIEKLSSYSVTHGIAVAYGLQIMTDACKKQGLLPEAAAKEICDLISFCGFRYDRGYKTEELIEAIKMDKKVSGDSIDLIVIKDIAKCEVMSLELNKLGDFVQC